MTAQRVVGIGPLTRISGTLSTGFATPPEGGSALTLPDYEDMYIIRIDQPSTFSFTTENATFNSSLYLFNITLANEAFGLLANYTFDGKSGDAGISGPATDGTGAAVVNPGIYAIAITGAGRVPVSSGGEIFNFVSFNETSGPDGPGGINPHTGWTGVGQVGTYEIAVTSVGFVDVPAPGFVGLAGVASLWASRRRRK